MMNIYIILRIQNIPIEKFDDNYYVMVKLKDSTPFAHSARRFACSKHQEIDKLSLIYVKKI